MTWISFLYLLTNVFFFKPVLFLLLHHKLPLYFLGDLMIAFYIHSVLIPTAYVFPLISWQPNVHVGKICPKNELVTYLWCYCLDEFSTTDEILSVIRSLVITLIIIIIITVILTVHLVIALTSSKNHRLRVLGILYCKFWWLLKKMRQCRIHRNLWKSHSRI